MIEPIQQDYDLYKGADFKIQFRIKEDGCVVDVSAWTFTFKVAEKQGADTNIISKSSGSGISVDTDDNYLITIHLTAAETAAITQTGVLYYEIDATTDEPETDRRIIGNVQIFESLS